MVALDFKKIFRGRVLQIIAVVTGSLSLTSDGMQVAWTSPISVILKSPTSPVSTKDSDLVWLENLYMIGGIFGLIVISFMLDRWGRKRSTIIFSVFTLVAWILTAFALSIELLFVARFIFGIVGFGNFSGMSMYTTEIADKTIRGRLQTLLQFQMIIGYIIIYSIGPLLSIAASSGIGAMIVVLQLLTFSFMPESPYFFLIQNKKDNAQNSLQWFRSTSDVKSELNEICEVVEKDNTERGRPLDLITIKSNRNVFFLLTLLSIFEQYSGSTVIMMNLHLILEDAPLILSADAVSILYSVFMLVGCFISVFLIDSSGRKVLLYSCCFLTGFALLPLASYYAVKNGGVNVDSWNWLPVVVLTFYAITYQCGLGIVPPLLCSEIYPTNIKVVGYNAYAITYSISSVTAITLFHFLQREYGMHAPLFLFGASTLIAALVTIFFVPETKGITLEEIQLLLKGKTPVNADDIENTNVNYGSNIKMWNSNCGTTE